MVHSSVYDTAASTEERRNEWKIAGEEREKWNLKEEIKQKGRVLDKEDEQKCLMNEVSVMYIVYSCTFFGGGGTVVGALGVGLGGA